MDSMDNMDRKIEKKKGLQRKHIIWIAGGVLFLFLLFQIFRNAVRDRSRLIATRLPLARLHGDSSMTTYV